MWIKPGQHGTSARSPSGHHHSPTRKRPADDLRSVLQRQTPARRPTIKVRARWRTRGRTALERLSLGRTWTAL